jgi:tetratricopeptide (TPR) repeat protein
VLAAVLLAASCADTAPPAPAVTPQGDERYLPDPRLGSEAPVAPQVERRLDTAWRYVLAGNEGEARRRIAEIRTKEPDYLPALLAEAALDIRTDRLDEAGRLIELAKKQDPHSLAALLYEAEIAARRKETRKAWELYRSLAARPGVPAAAGERLKELQTALFNAAFTAAMSAPDAEAVRLLREALAYNPGTNDVRILLAGKLVNLKQYDEARRELEPVLNSADVDRPDVQEALAEIDVGRGRYQEAIIRYERLARRTKEPRHADRLEVIKDEWSMSNMPPRFRQALDSGEITRADLAVLLYWTVPTVRFAQNLSSPPIAIDIENVSGRDEIIRSIALGLYDVDPVTRRVSPFRPITAERLTRHLARVLTLSGAQCARVSTPERDEVTRSRVILATCQVSDPLATFAADATISGRDAERMLEQVAKAAR